MPTIDFTVEPFRPARWLTNRHLQTVIPSRFRNPDNVTFRRKRLDTPDGDFLDLDFADVKGNTWQDLGDDTPICLMLHGLEGSAQRGYAVETYRQLAQRGIRSLGMNFRGCSGEINRTDRMYHAGLTTDIQFVIQYLQENFPDVKLGAVGASLGANMLLKLLGEQGNTCPLSAAVAISPPFDLNAGSGVLESGIGKFYNRYLLRKLREKSEIKADLIRDKVDLERAINATTLRTFDDAVIAPLYGFASAEDYYTQSSSGQFLHAIRTPTLLLRAIDDPFFDPSDIPHTVIAENPYLVNGIVKHGGHVGFMEGTPWSPHFWAERQAAHFLSTILLQSAP